MSQQQQQHDWRINVEPYRPSSASTDQIIRVDKFEAEGWRPKHYFTLRHRILRAKQELYNKDREGMGARKSSGVSVSHVDTYGSGADHQRQFVYVRWREFLLQTRSKNLFTFTGDRYGCRNDLSLVLKRYAAANPSLVASASSGSLVSGLDANWPMWQHSSGASSRLNNSLYDPDDDLRSQFEGAADSPRSTISTDSTWSISNLGRQTTSFAKHSIHEAYAFTGMHHIFDRPGASGVANTRIKFGNNDSDLLAFASSDGNISIATVIQPEVIHVLRGHNAAVTDFDFSIDNHYLISVAKDRSIRVWDTNKGSGVRIMYCTSSSSSTGKVVPTCVEFHPFNNNIFLVGFNDRTLTFYNLSTGKPAFQSWKVSAGVRSICFSPKGDLLFIGDVNSTVYMYTVNHISGKVRRRSKLQLVKKQKLPVTSLSYSEWTTAGRKAHPSLLVNLRGADAVYLFKVLSNGNLALDKMFPLRNRSETIRSVFCPLISFRNGACFVSGSESGEVLVFDLSLPAYSMGKRQPVINKLMGHASTVVDVAWDYQENILASCDSSGVVILWKRKAHAQLGSSPPERESGTASSSQTKLTPLQRSAKNISVPDSMKAST